jgi:hypothetical protein
MRRVSGADRRGLRVLRAFSVRVSSGGEVVTRKPALVCTTPHGTFTRKTAAAYTHVCVWQSDGIAKRAAVPGVNSGGGVVARWAKDNGYATTWHKTADAAARAVEAGYSWDASAKCLGVFPVELEIGGQGDPCEVCHKLARLRRAANGQLVCPTDYAGIAILDDAIKGLA